jgi:hypothetical protein
MCAKETKLLSRPSRDGTYLWQMRPWPAIYRVQTYGLGRPVDGYGTAIGSCGPRRKAVPASLAACNCLFQSAALCMSRCSVSTLHYTPRRLLKHTPVIATSVLLP